MKTKSVVIILILMTVVDLPLYPQAVYDKIVFSRMESGNDWDLWIMNTDGSSQTKLINNSYRDTGPCFNPQGTKIVFGRITSTMPMQADIYLVNADGSGESNLTNLTQISGPAMSPKFSWDGTKIVFDVQNTPGNGDIYMINPDGTGLTGILTDTNDDSSPHFSPDGNWIVFMRQLSMSPNPKAKICKVHISGSPVVELTSGNYLDETPVFAADGTHILFKRGFTQWDLFLMNADHNPATETDMINLTNSPYSPAGTAMYSWEGDKIVYYTSVNSSSPSDIYMMNTDGTNKRQLTNDSYIDFDPTFSPSSSTENDKLIEDKVFMNCEPNPFINEIRITVNLTVSDFSKIMITDASGRIIKSVYNGFLTSGNHSFKIAESNLPVGCYFLNLQSDNFRHITKLIKIN